MNSILILLDAGFSTAYCKFRFEHEFPFKVCPAPNHNARFPKAECERNVAWWNKNLAIFELEKIQKEPFLNAFTVNHIRYMSYSKRSTASNSLAKKSKSESKHNNNVNFN